jgi:hypothetical protein
MLIKQHGNFDLGRGSTLSKASWSKRQDLPKLGLFLQNLVKIFLVLWDLPKLGLLPQNLVKILLFCSKIWSNISSSVGVTKSRAFAAKSGQIFLVL